MKFEGWIKFMKLNPANILNIIQRCSNILKKNLYSFFHVAKIANLKVQILFL